MSTRKDKRSKGKQPVRETNKVPTKDNTTNKGKKREIQLLDKNEIWNPILYPHEDFDGTVYSHLINVQGCLVGVLHPRETDENIAEQHKKERGLEWRRKANRWESNQRYLLGYIHTMVSEKEESERNYGYSYRGSRLIIQDYPVNMRNILYDGIVHEIKDLIVANYNACDVNYISVLHLLCLFGSSAAVNMFLKKFPQLQSRYRDSPMPEHYAAIGGNFDIFERFLDNVEKPLKDSVLIECEQLSRAYGHQRMANKIAEFRKTKNAEQPIVRKIPLLFNMAVAVVADTLNGFKKHTVETPVSRISSGFRNVPLHHSKKGEVKTLITPQSDSPRLVRSYWNDNLLLVNMGKDEHDVYKSVADALPLTKHGLEKVVYFLSEHCPSHGWEVLEHLNHLIPLSERGIPPIALHRASDVWEAHWRTIYKYGLYHKDRPSLINVFEHYSSFVIEPEDDFERSFLAGRILKKERGPIGSPSIVNEQQFKDQFRAFTRGLLDFLDCENILVIGGAVCGSLLPLPSHVRPTFSRMADYYNNESPFKGSDIDIYVYGCQDPVEKVWQIYKSISRLQKKRYPGLKLHVTSTKYSLGLSLLYPFRNINILVGNFVSPFHILSGVDMDCSGFGFDGKKLWCLPRARLAMNRRWNILHTKGDLIRSTEATVLRALKYNQRGFTIIDPLFKDESQLVNKARYEWEIVGLELLLKATIDEASLESVKERIEKEKQGLPFGLEYRTSESFTKKVDDIMWSHFDGYFPDPSFPKNISEEKIASTINGFNGGFNVDKELFFNHWYTVFGNDFIP